MHMNEYIVRHIFKFQNHKICKALLNLIDTKFRLNIRLNSQLVIHGDPKIKSSSSSFKYRKLPHSSQQLPQMPLFHSSQIPLVSPYR